jgi:uncharacterized protein (DUF433 family)
MRWQDRVVVDPEVRSGKPCVEILGDFPDLARDDIRAALAFAAARERRVASPAA